uniref:hypothetical protein n=1 Tax=Pseudoalteromonas mariniglutinosa TaxID=206042 RepID=UPI00387F978D
MLKQVEKPSINELINAEKALIDSKLVAQACMQFLLRLSTSMQIEFLLELSSVKDKLQTLVTAISEIACIYNNHFSSSESAVLKSFYQPLSVDKKSVFNWFHSPELLRNDMKTVLGCFDNMREAEYVNSPLMSVFLLSLSAEQITSLANHASNTLTVDQTIQLLLKSGFAKHSLFANSMLHKVDEPKKIVASIRRCLGAQLDEIVSYDLQREVYNNQGALNEFQSEFKINWPSIAPQLSTQRVIYGYPLTQPLNAIMQLAMDCNSRIVLSHYLDFVQLQHAKQPLELQNEGA